MGDAQLVFLDTPGFVDEQYVRADAVCSWWRRGRACGCVCVRHSLVVQVTSHTHHTHAVTCAHHQLDCRDKSRYFKPLVTDAAHALARVDVVLLVVDSAKRWDESEVNVLRKVSATAFSNAARVFVVLNKADLWARDPKKKGVRFV